ncbi:proteasome subunit beta type-5-like, partial [Myiozetetes cayanensis]|uniref:proteasome subunit beta type-5-like n=1 Tax=Myiozetetes cayanensis TaxID=478635 RepID=UPI0021605451
PPIFTPHPLKITPHPSKTANHASNFTSYPPKFTSHPPNPTSHPPALTSPPFPGLYYVDSEGTRVAGTAFAVGSGSSYAYGVLDRGLGGSQDSLATSGDSVATPGGSLATPEAAWELARRAIYGAARRDAYSGGSVLVLHVGPAGWHQVSLHNVAQLQDIYGHQ